MTGLFEADLADGIALYDVSDRLPKHRTKRYRRRATPTEVYIHHSGKLGKPGFEGLRNSARYVVRYRGWPGIPYHYWLPYEELLDPYGRAVVLRGQRDEARTYHAGTGPNTRAVAVALQGNTSVRPPSDSQLKSLGGLLLWLEGRGLCSILGHCEATHDGHAKASCPGSHAMMFLDGYRTAAV